VYAPRITARGGPATPDALDRAPARACRPPGAVPNTIDALSGNRVPAQDASAPDGLVRRLFIDQGRPPTSVWVVAYRWDAGFNCHNPNGGPGPCDTTSFYFIDDRTGEMIYDSTITN
jgi:hypothetical protein